MKDLGQVLSALGGMPAGALFVCVILSAFALAAFAIYAVMTISRGKKDGD
jgi:hypothetical protein